MGRRPKFSSDQILDAAEDLIAEHGPAALSIVRVAKRLEAPSGSIYHRFASRDLLVASLWLRTVEHFQNSVIPTLDEPDPYAAARALARRVLEWTRENPLPAQLLMLHQSNDLIVGEWPAEVMDRNHQQRLRVDRMIEGLCERLGATTTAARRRVSFAVIDVPYGAVRSSLIAGEVVPPELDVIVDDAVVAVLDALRPAKDNP